MTQNTINLNNIDVSVTYLKTTDKNDFVATLEGTSINYSVANALRRCILMYIPIYGYNRKNIYIDLDKSYNMYNNDLLYNQIESLPIYDVDNYFDVLEPKIYLPTKVYNNIFNNFKNNSKEKEIYNENSEKEIYNENYESSTNDLATTNKGKIFEISLFLNIKNTTGSDKFVSTHDVVLKIDNVVSNSYKKYEPVSFMVLKPNESISLNANANLSISVIDAAYEATNNCVAICENENKYIIKYKSLGQLDKNIIFLKACSILQKKLQQLKKYIISEYSKLECDEEIIEIELHGEEHTLGNLIACTLQQCNGIKQSGYKMEHPLVNNIKIHYIVEDKFKKHSIKIFIDVIDYLINVFKKIGNYK